VLSLDSAVVRDALDLHSLVETLRTTFREGCEAPLRHHHAIAGAGAPSGMMLLMPAWVPGRYLGVKLVNVFPENGQRGLPAVQGIYALFSGQTGEMLATIDGNELTARRTVAASALAASYLARQDASTLLLVGTGRLARLMAQAHASVRPIRNVLVWGRDLAKAEALAAELRADFAQVEVATELAQAVSAADIVSCMTLSREPLVRGEWLRPGCHLDLVGGFTPEMREADDEAVRRASVFVDTSGALAEAGDIVIPLRTGVLARQDIRADLEALTRGTHPGRTRDDEITLFKSVGASLEDLAAAVLCYERVQAQSRAA
jgi:alanine dehydrogenase